jgi:sugar fermentation stimulation protein A
VTEQAARVTYVLLLYLPADRRIRIGRLGCLLFEKGLYFYVGSGGRSPLRRIARHIRKRKRKFWHIDFLTVKSRVVGALILESNVSLECTLARALRKRFKPVPGFGASDCRCGSHLFFAGVNCKEV